MPPCSPTVLLWPGLAEDVQDKGHSVCALCQPQPCDTGSAVVTPAAESPRGHVPCDSSHGATRQGLAGLALPSLPSPG